MSKANKIAIGAIVGVLLLLGGAYVAAYFVAGNQLPAKATVEGVSLGGLSPDQAEEKLATELAPRLDAGITINSGATSVSLDPAESGLSVDYEATIRAAGGGFSWHPADILRTFTGGQEVDLVRQVDQGQLHDAVESIAPQFAVDGTDATIAFNQGELVRTDAQEARELDVNSTAASVREAYESGASNVEATVVTTPPAVTDAMVDQVVAEFVDPLLSGPIPVTHGEQTMEVVPAAVASATTFAPEGDRIVPRVDAEILFEETGEARRALELSEPKDAGFSFSGGTISVVPAVVGETIEPEAFRDAVLAAAVKTGPERTASIDVTVQEPEFTTEQAEQLKPTEVIGEFSTRYPHAAYRNTNLGRAATSVNGTVLMPGEIFSLNDTLGPRTQANGYVDGYVINEGRLVKEGGGGISQAATTLYNAAFFAGYEDIEHKPHSLYFDRYPAGREATIYYGALDMRFRNDTEFPAVIQGYTNPSSPGERGTITFKIWSQRTYDKVESTELVKSDFYTGQDRILKGEPDCEPQAPIRGFTVTWKRLFYKGGQVVKEEPYRWKYSAGDRIICEP